MTPLLEVEDLAVHFAGRAGTVRAVDGVSFRIDRGQTLGLVGESGCGKSTLGKTLVGLVRPSAGQIRLDGREIGGLGRRARRPFARRLQMVFQDPFGSLNPRLTIGRIVEEPLIVHTRQRGAARSWRVAELLERVGLPAGSAARYPHELSGGQRQRVGIARALAVEPELLVCDEPVSALDLSVQAQVLNLLVDLQRDLGLAYLFISHDLAVVEHLADRVMVMYAGRIVETAAAAELWSMPLHPYTRTLVAAAPVLDFDSIDPPPAAAPEGEPSSAAPPPQGCAFRVRCTWRTARCAVERPVLAEALPGRLVACHEVTGNNN